MFGAHENKATCNRQIIANAALRNNTHHLPLHGQDCVLIFVEEVWHDVFIRFLSNNNIIVPRRSCIEWSYMAPGDGTMSEPKAFWFQDPAGCTGLGP